MNNKYELLVKEAIEAKNFAYAPYSNFHVGAAILTEDGKIYGGCNIENASYGATNCAERTAIFKGVSEGSKNIKAIVVATDEESFVYPCGICRQVIREFGSDCKVLLVNKYGEIKHSTIEELLPNSFTKEDFVMEEKDE